MLAAKNLERLLEIEAELKEQYEDKLKAKDEEIAKAEAQQSELQATIDKQKASLVKQQQEMMDLKSADNDTKRLEQVNRELMSRTAKLQEELEAQKKKNKVIQRDSQADRTELKELKQFDVKKMKKNLDANKKKIAELNSSNDLLQKNYNKFKSENSELKAKVKELEAKLEVADKEADEKGSAAKGKKEVSSGADLTTMGKDSEAKPIDAATETAA